MDISPQSAQSLQLCLTLCDPMVYSPSGSSVCGIFQARIPEWVTMLSPRWSSRPRNWTCVSCIAGRFFTCWATREAHFTTVDLANYPSLCQSITLGHRTVGGGKTSQRATCGVYCSRHISLAFHYFIHLRVHICFLETICSLWFKLIRADGVKKMMERQYNMVIENTDLHG